MRVLQLVQKNQKRGAEIFARDLAHELLEYNITSEILYLFGNNGDDTKNSNLNNLFLEADPKRRFFDIQAYRKLTEIINSKKYQIIQANAGDTLKYAIASKLIYGWKTPVVFRNANKMSFFFRNSIHKWLNSQLLKHADYIISVSENCRQDIIHIYPKAAEKTAVISIGTYDFSEVPTSDLKGEHPVWINIGSFVPEKNHMFLIELFRSYFQINRKGELWLIGDGKERRSLESLVHKLNLKDRVKFFGYRNDAIPILKAADIMVMPSKIEGMPGAILEALSSGIPVVCSNVGGICEVVKDGFNGYCISEFDSDSYLYKINQILDDSSKYDQFAINGKATIKNNYLMPQIAAKFAGYYEKILALD